MKKFSLLILIVISIFFNSSCNQNNLKIDISNVDVSISIKRFEQDLFAINEDSIIESIDYLEHKYPDFFNLYNYEIIRIGGTNNIEFVGRMNLFLNNETVISSYQKSKEVFSDISMLENELSDAFKHYKYYFPEKEIPQIISYVSGFNHQIVVADNLIGIGLDKYLGRNCKFYSQLGLPRYLMYKMHPKKIVSDCMLAWARSEFVFDDSINNLLSYMVYEGKLMYFLDAMLPNQSDTIKIGYSLKKLKWCKTNEENMWMFLIDKDLLFSHKSSDINRFINDGPFTAVFLKDSPARTGVYIGWQIVKLYMKNNPEISINNLMNENNYQKILSLSKYNP